MRIHKIWLRNIMGVKEYEIQPGKITEVSGSNGTGKSSIMSAIASAINGGHNKYLLKDGESTGEVVIELDDNTIITKKITPDKSDLKVVLDDRAVSSPATFVQKLFGTGFNPVRFLSLTDKERTKEILKAIKIEFDQEALDKITGQKLRGIDYFQHPLAVIDEIHKMVYESRRSYNSEISQLSGTVKTLKDSIVEIDLESLDAEMKAHGEKIDKINDAERKLQDEKHKKIEEIQSKLIADIEKLRAAAAEEVEKINASYSSEHDSNMEKLSVLRSESATINEKKAHYDKQEGLRTQLASVQKQLVVAEDNSKREDNILNGLEKYKKNLLSNVRIGPYKVDIDDGKLKIDGLPYDSINTAAKVTIAVELAAMNVGDARFCAIDGAECLDTESLGYLVKEAEKKDLQLLLFSVCDGDLSYNVIS